MKDVFGYLGSAFLTITLIPQLYLTYKTKKTRDISFVFLCLQLITCVFFLIYGIHLSENPLIIANSIVLFQSCLLFYAKIIFTDKHLTNTNDNDINDNDINDNNTNGLYNIISSWV